MDSLTIETKEYRRERYWFSLRVEPFRFEEDDEAWQRHEAALQRWMQRQLDRDAPGSVCGVIRVQANQPAMAWGGPSAINVRANFYRSPDPNHVDVLRPMVDSDRGQSVRVLVTDPRSIGLAKHPGS